jgi:hypothetical protein
MNPPQGVSPGLLTQSPSAEPVAAHPQADPLAE